MDTAKIKGYVSAVILITALTSSMVFFFNEGITSLKGIIDHAEYIYFDPKLICLFIALPSMLYLDLFFLCLILPFRKSTIKFMQKLMIPVTVYGVIAFAVGTIISIIISFSFLGTDYVKCHSTSIVSSGSSYAKSKEICIQKGSYGY
ncbi:hypothetical protein [Lelliottia wanjuensis]|uniref:DUF1240 domain-containing protein n=1 Tax=Lelliottia wanjuensis TaxID=3050585 RepID=A0AAP4D4A5_9ENTR|nr:MULTISPECIES: hypothetical protein [unclassified Lelliottia]MDK9363915.1 hypothetical protein [Lelliottia sp. V106_12]MDK9616771.1 hypothetical protein [Lelliottia sp. V106_9]